MLSKAHIVKGHGVLSAHDEQVQLVKESLSESFEVVENKWKFSNITHFHTINPTFLLRLPIARLRGKSVGYVHFLPETVENSIQLPRIIKEMYYKYILFFYKQMDYLVTVNPYFIDALENYGIDKNIVSYIPNYVSSQNFYPLDRKGKEELRRKYKLNTAQFTVLCVGQLQNRKGVLDFIEVSKKMPDIQFVWAGDFVFGKISDGYEKIKGVVSEAPKNVHFLGLIDRCKMNEIYNLSDVMFLPSYEELFPMTILESMNCEVPILLRNLDEYKDILFDFYLKGENVEDFVQLIHKLKTDSEFYQNASQMARRGHEFYSRENVSSLWKQFYEKVNLGGKLEKTTV